jgi:hypothetical protein
MSMRVDLMTNVCRLLNKQNQNFQIPRGLKVPNLTAYSRGNVQSKNL